MNIFQAKNTNIRNIWQKIDLIMLSQSLCFYVFITLFVCSTLHAKTNVLFSPRGLVKDTIINNINSSKESIEIAAFTFTSGEIAEALYKAKERGVKIRIIIDKRQGEKHYPVMEFLREEDFDLRFLKGSVGGAMNNTFAIFDSKLLVTGSYTWTEYAEKFNYENTLFIDDTDLIKRFRKEFEYLYDKSTIRGIISKSAESKSYVPASRVEVIKRSDGEEVGITTPVIRKNVQQEETHVEEKQVKLTNEPLKTFLNISFDDFDNIFGERSKLKKSEKKQLWKDKFEGKYVKWTGKVSYKGINIYNWNRIGISHKIPGIDVRLKFESTKKRKVMRLEVGDVITYTGRLVSLRFLLSPYKLDHGDIIRSK